MADVGDISSAGVDLVMSHGQCEPEVLLPVPFEYGSQILITLREPDPAGCLARSIKESGSQMSITSVRMI